MVCDCCCSSRESVLYKVIYDSLRFLNDRALRFFLWKAGLSNVPPHFIKFKIIKVYKGKFGLDTLVETGTYLGDTIAKARGCFKEIYSVEVDAVLFSKAKEKISCFKGIHILRGDSAEVLPEIGAKLTAPALFWLDAHYSGGITSGDAELSPIVKEVECILKDNSFEHVLLIDNANMFTVEKGYLNIEFLKKFVHKYRPDWGIYSEDNIIRAHAKSKVNNWKGNKLINSLYNFYRRDEWRIRIS